MRAASLDFRRADSLDYILGLAPISTPRRHIETNETKWVEGESRSAAAGAILR